MSLIFGESPRLPFVRAKLSLYKRRLTWLLKAMKTPRKEMWAFRCNVCGKSTSFPRQEIVREFWSCWHCGSSVRFRSVIHALSMELFGKSLAIPDFPDRPDLRGAGLSDWLGYATRLPKRIGYTNTFYHKAPLLDITSITPSQEGQYDFLISSDVFEHVCQPIATAFQNAYKLLKPGGVMILTVPYVGGETREHFPDLSTFSVTEEEEGWVLTGQTSDGSSRRYTNLTFHGGPGTTVEFRLFGKDSLLADCKKAGFNEVDIHGEEVKEFGVFWDPYVAENAPYRPLIYGLDTPPWALRKAGNKELKRDAQ